MRHGLNHHDTTGASPGDFVGFDPDLDEYVPMPLPVASPLVPWTTTLSDSTPALMWDDEDNLMMVEVPQ